MKEITPNRYRCGFTEECPAAFRLKDGRLVLIGKRADTHILNQLSDRIGNDEHAIIIEPGLLENVFVTE